MDILIIILVASVLFFNVYLFFKLQKNSNKEDFTELSKIKDDITGLKVSLNESFSNMSKEVAKDTTVSPTTRVETFNFKAKFTDDLTRSSPP